MSYNGENIMVMDEAWLRREIREDYDHYPEPQPAYCKDCGQQITHGSYCCSCCYVEMETLMFKTREHLAKGLERAQSQQDISVMVGMLQATIMWVQKTYMEQLVKLSKEVGDDA
jgi:hypothetical protein